MAKKSYGVIDGKNRQLKKMYAVIGGVTKKIKKMYAVVGGVIKQIFGGGELKYVGTVDTPKCYGKNTVKHGWNSKYGFLARSGTINNDPIVPIDSNLTVITNSLSIDSSYKATCSFNDNFIYPYTTKILTRVNTSLTKTNISNAASNGITSSTRLTSVPSYLLIGPEGWISPSWYSSIQAINKSWTKLSSTYGSHGSHAYSVGKTKTKGFFLGGYHDTTGSSATVDMLNDSLTRTTADNLSTSRRQMSDCWTDEYTFVAGGYHYTGSTTGTWTMDINAFNDSGTRVLATTWGTYNTWSENDLMESCGEEFAIVFGGTENSSTQTSGVRARNTATILDGKFTKSVVNIGEYAWGGGCTRVGNKAIFYPATAGTSASTSYGANANHFHYFEVA